MLHANGARKMVEEWEAENRQKLIHSITIWADNNAESAIISNAREGRRQCTVHIPQFIHNADARHYIRVLLEELTYIVEFVEADADIIIKW
jgi:hypothetical protein